MELVVARAPFRVSFAGGGTDLPGFYEADYGAVVSTAIDKYVYVIVKGREEPFGRGIDDPFKYRIRLSYSSTENVQHRWELQHPIVRGALELLDIDEPMDIATMADVPSGTGLGSSGTFAVALLRALHSFGGEAAPPEQIAAEAAHIEIDMIGRPVGKQDHYAAAVGGMNEIRFLPGGDVAVQPVRNAQTVANELFPSLLLLYTGTSRDAAAILSEQQSHIAETRVDLEAIRGHAEQLSKLFENGWSAKEFGDVLHRSWMLKRRLASSISNSAIDSWYEGALKAGALGGKVCGAGGGGFLLLVAEPDRREAILSACSELTEMPIGYEPKGVTLLSAGAVAEA
jgi:D-glycero-alpha-D-manno-heptose-7-phosphate kinase